jgi:hypothetical protein
VELDLADPQSTACYVPTDFIRDSFARIATAFDPSSTRRAWRITGDYGSGKSAFVLSLAKAVSGRAQEIPAPLGKTVTQDRVLPVIVTGNREPLLASISRSIFEQVKGLSQSRPPADLDALLDIVSAAGQAAKKRGYSGILLVLDELGKNLEFAAMHPSGDDVYVLQRLAEKAARTRDCVLIVLAVLHQGIASYVAGMDSSTRREWDKVAGRFDEIIFSHPLEQVVELCAHALAVDLRRVPAEMRLEAQEAMRRAIDAGMYGNASADILTGLAPRLFPLHPTVLPILMNLLRRFGQNERSLFGFLSGHEPSGLQEHAAMPLNQARFYRLPDLYSYFRSNLAHTVNNGKATHWRTIESVVSRAPSSPNCCVSVLQAVGLLNLLDDDILIASKDLMSDAVHLSDQVSVEEAFDVLRDSHLLFERGSIRGYCVWPHTSVHLDDAFADATKAIGEPQRPMQLVASLLHDHSVVARRHYIETGNLRHFDVSFHAGEEWQTMVTDAQESSRSDADGYVVFLLPESDAEYRTLCEQVPAHVSDGPPVVYGVVPPPTQLLNAALDVRRWQWVRDNVKELAADRYAREELKRQLCNAEALLQDRCNEIVGLGASDGESSISWFWHGKTLPVSANGLSGAISNICDEIYDQCPIIPNELINRRVTSSAASRARTALIDRIATHPHLPFLGMDESKNPPEMAIYLSVLRRGNVHVETDTGWSIVVPGTTQDACRLRPTLLAIDRLLATDNRRRVSATEIFSTLRAKPIGARDGILPLLLSIYIASHSHSTAVYEDGTFQASLGGFEFQRLAKEPEHFELQKCTIAGVKDHVFRGIASAIGVEVRARGDLLDVVRPLVEFISRLPEYSRNTAKLSSGARSLRHALLTARDPVKLILDDIPAALNTDSKDTSGLGSALSSAIAELRSSYDQLLDRIAGAISEAFETVESATSLRPELEHRCHSIGSKVADPELKGFILRLGDNALEYRSWLESLASHLTQRSAARWRDEDEDQFYIQLSILAKRMLRTEAALAHVIQHSASTGDLRAVRLALTQPDGVEKDGLLYWSAAEDASVSEATREIAQIIERHGRAGISAAAQALWTILEQEQSR